MPFTSKSQLRLCVSTQRWDCKQWVAHTPCIHCLPERKVDQPGSSRVVVKTRKVWGPVRLGPKGATFQILSEYVGNKLVGTTKLYLRRSKRNKEPSFYFTSART